MDELAPIRTLLEDLKALPEERRPSGTSRKENETALRYAACLTTNLAKRHFATLRA